jgi:hypothetical protein
MYSLFNLNIRAVICKLVDCIIKTLNIDYTDDEQVDSNNVLTLDFIVVNVPALLKLCNYRVEEP